VATRTDRSPAALTETASGLAPSGAGWFVVNVRDAAWFSNAALGAGCVFEGEGEARFTELGFRVRVLWPGQPNANYHSEAAQEDFLVLAGCCVLLVEGEERMLEPWDFVHSPAGVAHAFVGTGEGPCVLAMAGTRADEPRYVYPVSELARRHGAGVEAETTDPVEAYARFPAWEQRRPDGWGELPWGRA
jgi:uncharacterized cupin superfamily protein